jgi:UDP-glucose 4-epimerase
MGQLAYLDGVPHELVRAPLADRDAVRGAVEGADAVVHLAARAGIPDSVTDPLGTFDVNVSQTLGVLEAARRAGTRRFVFASSNAAAGDHEPPADETDLPHPRSPYGASKLAGEAYCQAYAATYGMAACALRFSNAYGPRSLHKKSVVAAWLRAALAGEPVTIHGDGEQTRDFVDVRDVARANWLALERKARGVFNIGSGQATTINQLAGLMTDVSGQPATIRHEGPRAGEVRHSAAEIGLAARVLGYSPTIALDAGLRHYLPWFATL